MSSGSTPWVSSALNPSHALPIKMAHMFTYAYIGNWMTLLVRSMCACTYANIGLQQQIHNNLVLHAPAQPSLAAHFKYSSMNYMYNNPKQSPVSIISPCQHTSEAWQPLQCCKALCV